MLYVGKILIYLLKFITHHIIKNNILFIFVVRFCVLTVRSINMSLSDALTWMILINSSSLSFCSGTFTLLRITGFYSFMMYVYCFFFYLDSLSERLRFDMQNSFKGVKYYLSIFSMLCFGTKRKFFCQLYKLLLLCECR